MDNLNEDLQLKKDSVVQFVNVIKNIVYKRKKQKELVEIIDYLEEQIYLRDLCLIEDQYELFFEELYDFFSQKNIIALYYKIMSDYINECLIDDECLQDRGDLNTFLKKLNDFNKILKKYDIELQKNEINQLKIKMKSKKNNNTTIDT